MLKKVVKNIGLVMLLTLCVGTSVFAGTLGTNVNGVYYVKDDGKLATSEWVTIDLDADGMLEYYYFNDGSALLTNTITPDGYQVNETGQWVENGVVKKVNSGVSANVSGAQGALAVSNNVGYGIICDDVGKVVELDGGKGQVVNINVTEFGKYINKFKIYYTVIAADVTKVTSSGVPHVKGKIICYDSFGTPCGDTIFILESKTTPLTEYFWAPQQTVRLAFAPWY